jgi:hypothetical protein
MLTLSCPVNQDRLNATVFEVLHLNVGGSVCILGDQWDCYSTLGYLEKRMKLPIIATQTIDGSAFCVCGKLIRFTDEGVFIFSMR